MQEVKHTKLLELTQEQYEEQYGVNLLQVKLTAKEGFWIAMLQIKDDNGVFWVLFDRGETAQHALNCVLYKSTLNTVQWKYDAYANTQSVNVNLTRRE